MPRPNRIPRRNGEAGVAVRWRAFSRSISIRSQHRIESEKQCVSLAYQPFRKLRVPSVVGVGNLHVVGLYPRSERVQSGNQRERLGLLSDQLCSPLLQQTLLLDVALG